MKRSILTFIIFTAGILWIICMADVESCLIAQAFDKPDGKDLFAKHCQNCHSADGPASLLKADSKTKTEWEEYFKKGKHLGQDLEKLASKEILEAIQVYCTTESKPDAQ